MYKNGLMGIPLILMLTACGSDSGGSDASTDSREYKGLKFTGIVYDGPLYDAEVSIYAGEKLLAQALLRNSLREPNCLQLIDSYTMH
ncbi:hypothetical protein M2G57_17325 [Vibrio vulnificus]|nr:hypothetical protein [Vibrio vulnificus]